MQISSQKQEILVLGGKNTLLLSLMIRKGLKILLLCWTETTLLYLHHLNVKMYIFEYEMRKVYNSLVHNQWK